MNSFLDALVDTDMQREVDLAPLDEFVSPLMSPTHYFEGQDGLYKMLLGFGLDERDAITTVGLIARALMKKRLD